MREVELRLAAEADIEEIADHTLERWGLAQARSYIAALRADITSLSEFAERYPVHRQSSLGLRRMASGHHLVFYRVGEGRVDVVRILHERRYLTQL